MTTLHKLYVLFFSFRLAVNEINGSLLPASSSALTHTALSHEIRPTENPRPGHGLQQQQQHHRSGQSGQCAGFAHNVQGESHACNILRNVDIQI